jgi:hypothetical protein
MKKFIALLCFIAALMVAVPAQAQLKFGIKGGLNLAGTPAQVWKSLGLGSTDNYTGFFIGPMAELTIPLVGIGVDAAVMYADKGYKIIGEKQTGVEVPLHLKWSIGLGDFLGVYLAAGPSFFFTSGKTLTGVKNPFSSIDPTKEGSVKFKKSQTALDLGVGVKLLNHLQAGVNYYLPISDAASTDGVQGVIDGYKSKTWQVSLAYLF